MTFFVKQTRMLLSIRRTILHGIPNISIQDYDSIHRHTDMIAIRHDLFRIPFSNRLERFRMILTGGNDTVYGTVMLQRSDVPLVNR